MEGRTIGFIGAGAMGEALMRGIIRAGIFPQNKVIASDVSPKRLEYIKNQLGIKVTADNSEVVNSADVIVFAVKPQFIAGVLEEIGQKIKPNQIVISIVAGKTASFFESYMVEGVPLIRVIPNTPSLVGEGATAISRGKYATAKEEALAEQIFGAVGKTVLINENLIDAATGVSGSGPAYIYMVIEAMADAGVEAGLTRDVATILAAQTVIGAGKMVLETGEHPGRLKDLVCSPGGTTIIGVRALEEGGMRAAMMHAVLASYQKAREMGQN